MSRRVGSPKAVVTAVTAAANSSGVSSAGGHARYSTYAVVEIPGAMREGADADRSRGRRSPAARRGPRDPPVDRRPRHGAGRRDRRANGCRSRSRSPSRAARCAPRSPSGSPTRSRRLPGVADVDVDLTVMTDERAPGAHAAQLRSRPGEPAHGTPPARTRSPTRARACSPSRRGRAASASRR